MRLRFPDLSPTRRLLAWALAVTLAVSAVLIVRDAKDLRFALGDTDDAMRLVMVRQLLQGRGWWDQLQTRLQPPTGVWMHWSRLLDGGIAGVERGLGLLVGPDRAEMATRIVWPLLWILPAVAAAMLAARGLAGRGERGRELRGWAVLAAGVLVLVGLGPLTVQFHPGRVDHHDVQITLALVVLAGAMASGVRGAVVAGAATGVGLAIGLEALLFEAALAASLGLRVLIDRREAPRAAAFGLTLAGVAAAAFAIQTPPARWATPACDALGSNLVAGVVLAGLGLAAAAWATRGRSWPWRVGALAAAGGAALAVYLLLDPRCTRGVFADVDPAIRPFWLDHVNEVRSWPQQWRSGRADAVAMAMAALLGLGSWAALGLVADRRRDAGWWTLGGALLLGCAAAWTAVRMRSYLEWFAVAPLAVAAAELARRAPRGAAVVAVVAAALLAPVTAAAVALVGGGSQPLRLPPAVASLLLGLLALAAAVVLLRVRREGWRSGAWLAAGVVPLAAVVGLALNADRLTRHAKPKPGDPPEFCYSAASYRVLAALPPGVVVSEVDLGPFVLAHTSSATMTAPYHRMSTGILAARAVLVAPVDRAQAAAAAIGRAAGGRPVYVLECRGHLRHFDRSGLAPDSLQVRLDARRPPAWLQAMSPPDAPITVYRATPGPGPVTAPPPR